MLDFDVVLAHGAAKPSSDQDEEGDPDRPMFSLMTGKYRHAKHYGGELLMSPFICSQVFLLIRNTTTGNDRLPAPSPSSSALVLRDQDRTIATLKDTAAGVLFFSLCDPPEALAESPFSQKAIFCNHERSVASKHVQGWIHLASFNKDGAVSRGAMVTTIELRMSNGTSALHKNVGRSESRADSNFTVLS